MSELTERWIKVIGLGILVWLVPFLLENAFYYVQLYIEPIYYSLVMLLGLTVTLIALASYLPGVRIPLVQEGWKLGVIWLALALAGDSAFNLLMHKGEFDFLHYLAHNGWTHCYILVAAVCCGYLAHAIDLRSTPATQAPSVLPMR